MIHFSYTDEDGECTGGKEFTLCGSACAPTCKERKDVFCPTVCLEGCFCPKGTVENNGECINPKDCPGK